jgi:hypothetical protein
MNNAKGFIVYNELEAELQQAFNAYISGLAPISTVRILKATVIYEIYLKLIKNINLFDRNHKNAF